MSYLKYSNLCADMVRAALKDVAKAKAKPREVIYYRSAVWKNGQPEKQGALARGWQQAPEEGRRGAGRPAQEGGGPVGAACAGLCGQPLVLCLQCSEAQPVGM